MEVKQAITQRTSCRAFLDKEPAKELLEAILKQANQSPSFMNTQPWEVYLVRGARKEKLAKRLHDEALAASPHAADFPLPAGWPAPHETRMKEHRSRRFSFLGIDPDREPAKVAEAMRRNFIFFGAPVALVIALDRTLTSWSVFDLGLFVQSILLAAHGEGLGACPQAMPTVYSKTIREELGLKENLSVALVISLGFPDPEARINKYRSLRRNLEDFTTWVGF